MKSLSERFDVVLMIAIVISTNHSELHTMVGALKYAARIASDMAGRIDRFPMDCVRSSLFDS